MSKPEIVPYRHLQYAETLITENEALTVKPYKDQVGKWTIGYGRNLDDRGIRYNEAELMLANDIEEAQHALEIELGFYAGLSDARKAVMIDLYHNLGFEGLMEFKKMLKAIQVEDWDKAAYELKDSKYWNQVGIRAKRNYCMILFNKYYTVSETKKYFENND